MRVWQWPLSTGRLMRYPASRARQQMSMGRRGVSTRRVLSPLRSYRGTLYFRPTASYPAARKARPVLSPTQEPSMMEMSRTPCSRRYSMAPERTPAWVVAPSSGRPATTRLGLRATDAPAGMAAATSARSIRAMVMAWASRPKIS